MITLKLTKADQERFGCQSADDVKALLELGHEAQSNTADTASTEILNARIAELESQLEAASKAVAEAESSEAALIEKLLKDERLVTRNGVNAEHIIETAVAKARELCAKDVSAMIGKVGVNALEHDKADVTNSRGNIAADDYVGQWNASEELQQQFMSADTYKAYKIAESRGMVAIKSNRN